MTSATRNEVLLLLIAVVVVAWQAPHLPASLEVGELIAGAALALLLQGGVRDVVSLIREKRRKASGVVAAEVPHEAHCMCLESTIGLSGVLLGVVLTALLTNGSRVGLLVWIWPVGIAMIGLTGLGIRDLVIQWKPKIRLLRVKDHGSILVRFR